MSARRAQAAERRATVVASAARRFRERGLDGIGVADLMKEAGLTHGGFYAHFESKEALMAEACAFALERSAARWEDLIGNEPGDPLAAIVDHYLSARHRDDPGAGCALPALGGDVARHGPRVRHAFARGLRLLVGRLADHVPGRTPAARRRRALAACASMVGAILLARAVDDEALSTEILDAVLSAIKRRPAGAP